MATFLLEIRTEEIPANALPGARQQLAAGFTSRLAEAGFSELDVTTLSRLGVGDSVNLEVDVFGKYVKQYLDRVLPGLVAAAQNARGDESG